MKVLAATFLAMLGVDTIGALDPFGGKVYLPSPRAYLAAVLLWSILGLVAAFGPRWSRAAGQLSVVVLLAGAVLGPFGAKAVAFLESSSRFISEGGTS